MHQCFVPMQNGYNTITSMRSEDADEFVRRMQGRTMADELELAGFSRDMFMNQMSTFTDAELMPECTNKAFKARDGHRTQKGWEVFWNGDMTYLVPV